MPNEDDPETSTNQLIQRPESQSEVLTKANKQGDVGEKTRNDQDQRSTAKEMRREFRWFELTSIAINLALAIIGVLALSIYHGQLAVMSGQLAEMQEARKQSKVDNAAAIAAQQKIATDALIASQENFQKSSENAEAAFRNEQRAWIGISNHTVTKFDQNGVRSSLTR
jgi:hypothetical protein